VVGIPFFDNYVEKATMEFLDTAAKSNKPFFINVNFMKVHQPNMPAPEFVHKSISKTKYADSIVELDTRIGRIMDKLKALGLDKNTLVVYTTDNGAWQDVYPDAGYTPSGVPKAPCARGQPGSGDHGLAWQNQARHQKSRHHRWSRFDGHFRLRGRCQTAGQGPRRQADHLRQLRYDPGTSRHRPDPRKEWFYFTENELSPGAARVGNYKAVFNLRGDNGAVTGGLAVDTNQGWKGQPNTWRPCRKSSTCWQDPQERYDIFMNNFTEHTWTMVRSALRLRS
jgi:arylsulfatase